MSVYRTPEEPAKPRLISAQEAHRVASQVRSEKVEKARREAEENAERHLPNAMAQVRDAVNGGCFSKILTYSGASSSDLEALASRFRALGFHTKVDVNLGGTTYWTLRVSWANPE